MSTFVAAAAAFAAADPHHLLEARQMQALSFVVHIPLVCFAIGFPTMVLFAEWRFLRTGDPLFCTLAMRWSKVMLSLFAVGVVTGTILSFELGLPWPRFMALFGNVFGLAFALEGFSFFVEAIFIAIYVYGWNRLAPRVHFLSGLPVVLAGITGSFGRAASCFATAGPSTRAPGRLCSPTRTSGTSGCTCTSPRTSSRGSWSRGSMRWPTSEGARGATSGRLSRSRSRLRRSPRRCRSSSATGRRARSPERSR